MKHIKKISTLLIIIMASWQLMGCAAANSKEMLTMLERQEAIVIEVAEPISQEQGTELPYEWTELAYLDNYESFRITVDDILNITAHGNNGKNGILYVDLEGNHTNNSTMYFAFSNQKFIDNAWNNSETLPKLLEATKAIYADVETDAVAKVAFLNAYFNILPDAEPNYFNGNQTLTRAEYLAAVYRAGTPVSTLETDIEFASLVDPLGTNENTAFANQIADYSYLTIADESLNDKTFNGTISRAEAIYTIVRMYYNDEYEALTGKESSFSDIKNGGDILEKVGKKYFKENETTADTTKFGKSYELSYMLQNPDKGVTPELYKAMVVAKNHSLITGTECRWDEGITKGETINLLSKVYLDLGTTTNADRGDADGENLSNIGSTTENGNHTGSSTEVSGKLHIYKDENGTVIYSAELGKAIVEALKAENLAESWKSGLAKYYYSETLSEDNTVIHYDILEGLASTMANELAEAANNDSTGGNTSNNQENTNNGGNGNSSNNNNGSSSSNNGGGSGNSSNNSGGGNSSSTDDGGYVDNGDGTITSSDGTFTMGDGSGFGGGGRVETGATIGTP